MHILYFHQHFCTPKGSAGIRSYGMSKKLIQRGHTVTVVCGSFVGANTGLNSKFKNGMRAGIVNKINVIEFDLSYGNSDGFFKRTITMFRYLYRASLIVLKKDYDLIFATSTPLTASIPGLFGKWFRKKPFVFEVRDLWPELPKAMGVIKNKIILMLMSVLEYISYHNADHLIALSPGILDGIAKRGIDKKNITLIPNGCDLSIFGSESDVYQIPYTKKSDFIALFSGTHGVANGLKSVIDAAYELKLRNLSSIKFVLIGQGKLKNSLINQCKEKELDNVVFLDPVPKKELSKILHRADIGLQILANVPAFYYGTSPNKFFDYISSGLPVLNNYPGWLAEMINENNCGLVVPPDSPVLFADALDYISKNKDILINMGKNAKNLAVKNFNRDDLSYKFSIVLEEIYKNK